MIKSNKLKNVQQSFAKILPDGEHISYENLPYFPNIAVVHVQGFTKTCIDGKEYSLFTHSDNKNSSIIIKDAPKSEHYKTISIPELNHPAGIQAVGQYVFVPCEYKQKSTLLP